MAPSVFLGLVTHDATRFPQARGPQGLLAQTQTVLRDRGISVQSEIHSANHFPELNLRISASDVRASIKAELSLEAAWRRYLEPDKNHFLSNARLTAWRSYRIFNEAVRKTKRRHGPRGRAGIERLINIELAHLHLMKSATKSKSNWVLILEDDAMTPEPRTFANDFANFVIQDSSLPPPAFVNTSQSFDAQDLHVAHLLTPIGAWGSGVSILQSSQPVTNTVCAVLYQRDFLNQLVQRLEEIPIEPVLPIDWKINLALMKMFYSKKFNAGDCWLLHPAPITQGSMH